MRNIEYDADVSEGKCIGHIDDCLGVVKNFILTPPPELSGTPAFGSRPLKIDLPKLRQ